MHNIKSQTVNHHEDWDQIIQPPKSLLNLPLKDVWQYRDLLWLLVRRDFVTFYKQTIFGPLWFFIQPIFTTIIFTFVFSRMAGISTEGVPPPLFYITGTVAWNYFSECLIKTSTVFKDNATMFGKVYFPRIIMPLSIVVSNLVKFSVQLLLVFIMMGWYLIHDVTFSPNQFIFLIPLLIVLMAMQGLGWGLIISAMTTKYRDLAFLVTFGVQLMLYATPVIYPLSTVPERYKYIIELNPLTGLIETFRYGFLGTGEFYGKVFCYSFVISFLLLFVGLIIFNKVEKSFVDTI